MRELQKFRTQATPKGQVIPIDKKLNSKIDCYPFANEWKAANQNQWTHGEWRETRTPLVPELNDARIALTMLPAETTFCELFNTNKRV